MCVLDRQGIPKCLLQGADERAIDFITAIGTLKAFSLITSERTGENFEMHRLVQLATQRWLEAGDTMSHWQQEALKVLSDTFPSAEFETWQTCNKLVPHVQVVLGYSNGTEDFHFARASLLNSESWYDMLQGRYQIAFDKCLEAFTI
jgi:hypothetical protein